MVRKRIRINVGGERVRSSVDRHRKEMGASEIRDEEKISLKFVSRTFFMISSMKEPSGGDQYLIPHAVL